MKKLMIIAAVALCAAYANAAAFSWKTTASLTTDGSAIATSSAAMNGGTFALVYLGDDSSKLNWGAAKDNIVDTATPILRRQLSRSRRAQCSSSSAWRALLSAAAARNLISSDKVKKPPSHEDGFLLA